MDWVVFRKMTSMRSLLFSCLFLTNFLFMNAQSGESPTILFPEELEREVALSSLPEHLRDEAGVYIFKKDKGYEMIKASTNGFIALVERIPGVHDAFAPVSYDSIGQMHHVKRILKVGEWIANGMTPKSIAQKVKEGFENGTFTPPSEFGISYMLSPVNILPSPPEGAPALYYPHFMVYAPNVAPSQLGLPKFHWHSYQPSILDKGPHGYLIVRLGDKETDEIRQNHKLLIKKVEKHLGKKLSSYEIAEHHDH